MKKAAVCFDLGGTLVELRGMVERVSSLIRKRLPRSALDASDLAKRWAISTAEALPHAQGSDFLPERFIAAQVLRDVVASASLEISHDEALELVRSAWSAFVADAVVCSDVTDAWWREIHAWSDGIALVTDIDEEAASKLLENLRIRSHFDAVVLSETNRAYKPSPSLYQHAMDALRAKSARSLFVSDSSVDLLGATAVGMSAALIQRPLRISAMEPPVNAFIMKSLDELPAILSMYARTGRFRP